LGAGVLTLIAALIVLIEPHGSLTAIAVVLGVYLVIVGIILVAGAALIDLNRWLVVALGVLAAIAGLFVIIHPGTAITTVRIVFGIYLLITGIVHLDAARRSQGDRLAETLPGALGVIAGLVFLFAPKLGLAALALFVGIYLLIRAAVDFTLAWHMHRAAERQERNSGPRAVPTPGREARH
jgi:uncharacterized membrane protein HdeD (DUF308 family)